MLGYCEMRTAITSPAICTHTQNYRTFKLHTPEIQVPENSPSFTDDKSKPQEVGNFS